MSSIVHRAGKLKPEARLGQAISNFRDALETEQKAQFDALKVKAAPTPSDAVKLAEEINEKAQKARFSWKPYGTRVQNALGVIQTLTAVGDVMVGGSQNLIASGAWAAIRVALIWSIMSLSLFEKITEKLMRIRRLTSIYQETTGLFSHDAKLRDIVLDYLTVVVDMSKSIVEFRATNPVSRFIKAPSISKEMQEYETRLSEQAGHFNDRVQLLHSQMLVEMTKTLKKEKDRKRNHLRYMELMNFLSPNQDELDHAWTRHRKKGTVRWVFDHPNFQWWVSDVEMKTTKDPQPLSPGHLVITGSIGQGKTVLMANVVSHLKAVENASLVAAVFCERSNAKTLGSDIVIGSIVRQLAKAIVDGYFESKEGRIPRELTVTDPTRNPSDLAQMIGTAAGEAAILGPRYSKCFIVLDGIGYLSKQEAVQVLDFLKALRSSFPQARACISVPSGSALFQLVSLRAGVSDASGDLRYLDLANKAFNDELDEFIRQKLESCPDFQVLDASDQDWIRQAIRDQTGGIYIWASLQIDYLFPIFSMSRPAREDLLDLVRQLPGELRELFNAALQSITYTKYQPRIFQFIIAAKRPLNVSEILIALSVQLKDGLIDKEWYEKDIPSWTDAATAIYECSGGLLELDEEHDTVHFVHESVYYYLVDKNTDWTSLMQGIRAVRPGLSPWLVSPEHSDLQLCKICLKYLDLPMHGRQLIKFGDVKQQSIHPKGILEKLGDESPVFKAAAQAVGYRGRGPQGHDLRHLMKMKENYDGDQRNHYRKSGDTEVWPMALLNYASTYWLEHCDHWMWGAGGYRGSPENPHGDILNDHFQKALSGLCAAATTLPAPIKLLLEQKDQDSSARESRRNSQRDPNNQVLFVNALEWVVKHNHMRLFWAIFDHIHNTPSGSILQQVVYAPPSVGDDGPRTSIVCYCPSNILQDREIPFFTLEKRDRDGLSAEATFQVIEYLRVYEAQRRVPGLGYFYESLLIEARKLAETHGERRLARAILCMQVPLRTKHPTGRTYATSNSLSDDFLASAEAMFDMIEPLDIVGLGPTQRYLKEPLSTWWCQTDKRDMIIINRSLVVRALSTLRSAKVPCHLRDEQGMTPLRLGIDLKPTTWEISEINMWWECRDCQVQDHPPGTLQLAIELQAVTVVTHFCEKGHISNTVIFHNTPEIVLRPEHSLLSRRSLMDNAQDMVQALNGAGGDVYSTPSYSPGRPPEVSSISIKPRSSKRI